MMTQPNLFEPIPEPVAETAAVRPLPVPRVVASQVPFDVALMALAVVDGLGQKTLESLVAQFGDDLGAVLGLTESELVEVFKAGDIRQQRGINLPALWVGW